MTTAAIEIEYPAPTIQGMYATGVSWLNQLQAVVQNYLDRRESPPEAIVTPLRRAADDPVLLSMWLAGSECAGTDNRIDACQRLIAHASERNDEEMARYYIARLRELQSKAAREMTAYFQGHRSLRPADLDRTLADARTMLASSDPT